MKVLLYDVDFNSEVIIEDGFVLGIECESASYFSSLIANLKGYCSEHIAILGDNGKELNLTRDVLTIIDFYSTEQITKAALSKFYKQMDSVYRDEESFNYVDKVERVISDLLGTIDFYNMDFEYDVPSTMSSYMKLCDVRLKNYSGGVYEDLVNLATLIGITKSYKVTTLINAKSMFTENELNEIAKSFIYAKQPLILIDNLLKKEKIEKEKKLVIDADFYDIML